MAEERNTELNKAEVSVVPLTNPRLLLNCGRAGIILASNSIDVALLTLPIEQGKLIVASTNSGMIEITPDQVNHVSTLTATNKKAPNSGPIVYIRVPVGVRFYGITDASADLGQVFFYEAGDGYNVIPHLVPLDANSEESQQVPELAMVTTHVPPRLPLPIAQATPSVDFPKLTSDQFRIRVEQDGFILE